jgi:hypothetical protein
MTEGPRLSRRLDQAAGAAAKSGGRAAGCNPTAALETKQRRVDRGIA